MIRRIHLQANKLHDKLSMARYFRNYLFLGKCGNNLDAIADILSEVEIETHIYISKECLEEMLQEEYSSRVYQMLLDVSHDNPNIHLFLAEMCS